MHGVDPETESALFTSARYIIIDDTGSFELLLSQLLQAVLAVEDGGDKDGVNLSVALADISRSQAVLNTHGLRIGDHFCGPLEIISLLKCIKRAVCTIKLV